MLVAMYALDVLSAMYALDDLSPMYVLDVLYVINPMYTLNESSNGKEHTHTHAFSFQSSKI